MPAMAHMAHDEALRSLRKALATVEPIQGFPPGVNDAAVPLGLPMVDAVLGGGLANAALHELCPVAPAHLGAGFGFALAIAARAVIRSAAAARQALLIETDFVGLEGGKPYGAGLDLFGLPLGRLLILRVARPRDALWAFEEALKSPALAAVVAELPDDGAIADLTATRRLSLAARAGGAIGLLLRHRRAPGATTATTRWQVAAAASAPDRFGGFGYTTFDLSLDKNRRGRCGRFMVSWDHATRSFIPQTLPFALAETACDRSDRAHHIRSG